MPVFKAHKDGRHLAGHTGVTSLGDEERVPIQAASTEAIRLQVANPAPLGLYAFGLTTALLQGVYTGITAEASGTAGNLNYTYAFAMAYGGLAQLLAGMWELLRNNTFAATAFSSYGAFWLGIGLYGILGHVGVWNHSHNSEKLAGAYADLKGDQMVLSLWGILTFLFFIQTLRINRALQALFFTLSCLFFFLAGGKHQPILTKFAGWWGLVVAAIAFYIATSELMTETWGLTASGGDYLPLGRYKATKRTTSARTMSARVLDTSHGRNNAGTNGGRQALETGAPEGKTTV